MKEVWEFLKNTTVYYLATVDGDKPKVRPFGTAEIFENKLYIQTGKVKDVSKQIEKNPYVEICAFNGEKWIRVSGKLIRDERIEPKEYMLEQNPELKEMYKADDDNTEVLYFESAEATIYSFGSEPKIIKF